MTKITHLIDDTAVGGVNRMLTDQTKVLGKTFDIDRLVVSPRRPLPPEVDSDIVIVHYTPSWSKLPFTTLLRAQRPDRRIVHVEHTFTRNFEAQCVPSLRRFRKMLRLTYRLADVVVAVSHAQAEWLLEAELLPSAKLVVIEPSVDLNSLLAVPEASRLTTRPLRIAAYGRYSRQKGFDVLLAAMRHVAPGTASLTMAGYGADEANLRAAAEGLPHVAIGGPVGDLASFLSAHDAVVVPSRWEAFGLVATEARAAARSIIVSDADGLGGQVNDSYGLITSAGDPSELAAAICRLATCNRVGSADAARASVVRHHQTHLSAWTQLLLKLT
jgi:glycosyltransferase involved in cell wall biosynthesis